LEEALNIGYETDIRIITPMMDIDKADTFAMAEKLGCLDEVIEDSHTCYNGDRSERHAWGYGCGKCPACTIRANGYDQFIARRAPVELHRDIPGMAV
jgi:7-cyano-7-deazaguanine synthase